MGGGGTLRQLRRLSGSGRHSGIGLIGLGLLSLGWSAEADAQNAAGPPGVGIQRGIGLVPAPATPAAPGTPGAQGAAGTAAGNAVGQVLPGTWVITPSVEVGETWNDNITLAPKGSETRDFITTVTPGLNILLQAPRVNFAVNYAPQALIFADHSNFDTLQQRLAGKGRAEIIPENLFFDAGASIDQEFQTANGAIGPSTITASSNLQTVEAASASPYLLHHFGSFADTETRYRFSTVSVSGDSIAPERINEVRQLINSGETFGRLSWVATGDYQKIDRLTGTDDPLGGTSGKDLLGRVDLKYPVYQALSAIGGAGWESVKDPTLGFNPHGVIWDGGFQYQPNETFLASATYGRRFDQTDWEANLAYNPAPDLRLHGSYSLSIQTTPSAIAGNLNNIAIGPNGTLVDSQTGLPFVANNTIPGRATSAFGINSGAFLEKRLEADAQTTRGRNTFYATGYDIRESGQTISAERIFGGSASWQRSLWEQLSSIAGAAYYRTLFEDGSGRKDKTYDVSVGLTYALSPTAGARLTFSRFDTRSNFPAESLINDLIMISLRKQF